MYGSISQSSLISSQDPEECSRGHDDMKVQPMPEYLRLEDHYQPATSGGPSTGSQEHWFHSSSSLMSLDEFLEQVSYQEHLVGDGKAAATEPLIKVDFSASDLALATSPNSVYQFDPSNVRFNEDELKPQPIMSKSRKTDGRYWARRAKNNVAAKRSREARRLKENQIFLRANYLEKENCALRESIDRLSEENDRLREQLQNFK